MTLLTSIATCWLSWGRDGPLVPGANLDAARLLGEATTESPCQCEPLAIVPRAESLVQRSFVAHAADDRLVTLEPRRASTATQQPIPGPAARHRTQDCGSAEVASAAVMKGFMVGTMNPANRRFIATAHLAMRQHRPERLMDRATMKGFTVPTMNPLSWPFMAPRNS